MKSYYIPYKNSQIHYRITGDGSDIILCFHGFGEFAQTFEVIAKNLDSRITLIAIDLPHHGATNWLEGNEFSLGDLHSIIEELPGIRNNKFGLMGYSLGGRVCLALFQHMPDRVNRLILLAPDGIKINFWYWLATQNSPGNRLFRYTMNYPGWFAGILRLAKKLKMANESIFRFVTTHLNDKTMREKVYAVWTTMRKFKPDLNLIRKLIKERNTPVALIYGKFDRIIRYKNSWRLTRGIEKNCEIVILDSGHQLLHNRNAKEIARVLKRELRLNI